MTGLAALLALLPPALACQPNRAVRWLAGAVDGFPPPPTGWTVGPDPDLTVPGWIGAPEIAAKDRPECSSAGFGPGWAIDVGMSEPVLLVGRVSRAPGQPPGEGWLPWPGSWTDEDLRFMVRGVYGDADLKVWAVDAAGNVSAEPLRLQVRGDLLTVAPPIGWRGSRHAGLP